VTIAAACKSDAPASFPPAPPPTEASAAALVKQAAPAQLELFSSFEAPMLEPLLRAYLEDNPGVDVKTTRLSESDLEARLSRGELRGDIVLGLSREDMPALAKLGRLAPLRPAECGQIPAQYRDPDGKWIGLTINAVALGVSEPQLREKQLQLPREWKELMKPQFNGQTVLARPPLSRAARLLVAGLTAQYHPRGWDIWKRIDKNLFQYTPNEDDPARMVGSGEVIFAIDFEKRLLAQRADKKPVVIHYPEPTYFDVETVAVPTTAKNTAEAARFAGWLCGPRAMTEMDRFRGGVTRPFLDSGVPGKRRLSQIKLSPLPARALAKDEFLEEWRDRYGK